MSQISQAGVAALAINLQPPPEPRYPRSLTDVLPWARQHGLSVEEARERFIHFAVLHVLASAPRFRDGLVLRGAGALYLFYGNPRPTADLDLIDLSMPPSPSPARCRSEEADVGKCLAEGLPAMFPDFAKWGPYLRSRVALHVSPRRSLLRFGCVNLASSPEVWIGVADLHFLISEKIAAILSQHWPSEKARGHDVPDIAAMVAKFGEGLQSNLISEYFRSLCEVAPRLAGVGFDPPLRKALASAYTILDKSAPAQAIPFDKAWAAVLALARQMAISVSE